ncbi:MAG: hypothetical protein DMF79_01610 [Acidobacteria bacterium]|nr:MAG: hypothetical protein DMF79_01610 [Acidobacteriota bacterium]
MFFSASTVRYDYCPVCDWEDDGTQFSNPTSEGGANKTSLADAQAAILRRIPIEVQDFEGHTRPKSWRPLRLDEIAAANSAKAREHWHSMAIADVSEAYWSRGGA